ncbi:Beta-flanking protein [Madurella fahalii]|uniref:Beta-flanking protein n=1 Tax=Madurella fahalii TaxID=1157608 RepID=A0ABQ0FWX7_9PEZI
MDRLLNKAVDKVFGDDDERAQVQHHGGGNVTHGGAYPAGGGYVDSEDEDDDKLIRNASQKAANNVEDEDSSFFSSILGQVIQKKKQVSEDDIDEEDAVKSHRKFFGSTAPDHTESSSASPFSAQLGSAAAVQALKLFISSDEGGASQAPQKQSQSAFVGLAMAQAAKLFDKQAAEGKVASGEDKQSAVMKAGEMALKMYLKSQGSGGASGGSGGFVDMVSIASKFVR